MSDHEKQGQTRRQFACNVALAAATAAVIPSEALAQTQKAATPVKPPQPPQTDDTKDLSAASRAEVERNYQAVMQQYGNRFNDAQKRDIHRLLAQQQKTVDTLRGFPLKNGDEPALVLHLDTRKG